MEINSEGLGKGDVLEILKDVSGDRPGIDFLADRLHHVTGGNPFYILEMIRTLAEEEGLDGELKQLEEIPLPPSIQEIVVGRLKRLMGKPGKFLKLVRFCCILLVNNFQKRWE
jgi:hypothetical protein